MINGVADNPASLSFPGKHSQRDQADRRPVVPDLELTIERAPQGGRRCRTCAEVCGRYACQPTARRGEWRYAEAGMDLTVSLIQRERDASPRLLASIMVKKEGRLHTRAVYSSEQLGTGTLDGPWLLKLRFEESECEFVFPFTVEVVSKSNKLSVPAAAG
jgi:hypothetical protein